jgi:uncharacterized repeat protein (TIGR01451 family)
MRQTSMLRTLLRLTTVTALIAVTPVVAVTNASASPSPLAVTMSATPNPVASGSSLTYTITATNSEPQLTNVRMTDQLTGLTNVVLSSSRGYCTLSSDLVSCSAGSMPGQNETWTVTITGLVTAATGTYLNNTATVTGDWSAQNTSQNYAVPATTSVLVSNQPTSGLADLSVSIIAPSTAAPGSNQTYQLTVNNSGGANATDVDLRATLPNGFGLQSGQSVNGTSLFDCSHSAAPNIVCTGGAVNAGANATVTIPVVVSSTTPASGSLTYQTTAVVDPENAIAESNELNNTAQQTLTVPAAPPPAEPVTFVKTAASTVDPTGAQVRPNDTLTYTLTVKNTSTKDSATRVQVTDGTQGLDQAAVSAKSSDPKFICTNSNSQVKCAASNNNYTLGAGSALTVTISGRVVQPPSSIITNTATLQTLQNKVAITRTASVTTVDRPQYDLAVTQFAECALAAPATGASPSLLPCPPFRARNQFDYLITVGNSGLNDATGVTIREPLPSGVIYEGYDNLDLNGGFTCAESTSGPTVVTCTGGTVPGQLSSSSYQGTIRQIRLHLTAPNSTGPITGTVTADPYNTIPESDETNNTYTTTTPIATGTDLTITQALRCPRDTRAATLMCDPVAPSGTMIYDITVTNVGTQDAGGIKLTDILPNGARFRSAKEVPPVYSPSGPYTPAHGLSCASDGASAVTCTGGRLFGSYAAHGGPKLRTTGSFDAFVIEVTAFAPSPYGPNSSPTATGSPILNQAIVDPDNTVSEYNENNDLNLLETNVGIPPAGDWGTYNELSVVNQQVNPVDGSTPVAVAPNGTLDYELTVRNSGSDPVSNVTVYDYVPDGSRFRNVQVAPLANGTGGFVCSFNSGLVTCANGALAAAPAVGTPTSTTITIRLFAPPTVNAATTQYTNHAVVDPANAVPEADETNNASDVPLRVDLPAPNGTGANTFNDLVLDNVQTNPTSGTAVAPNGTLQYTLTVKNRGSDPVSNVTVADYLPQGARFRDVSAAPLSSGNGGFVCSFNGGVVTCTGGSLAGAASLGSPATTTIKILLFAPDTPNDQTTQYTNHAVVDPSNTVPEGDETNNASDAGLTVKNAPDGANAFNELQVSTPQSFPASNGHVAPGGTLVYNLVVSNAGSDPASHVVVKDYLPTGTTYRVAKLDPTGTGAHSGGFVCAQDSGAVTCSNGTLGAGEQAQIKLVLFAPSQPSSPGSLTTITNQAVVDPDNTIPEGNETNNTATQDSIVDGSSTNGSYWDLTTSLAGSDTTGTPDSNVTFKVTVQNLGTDDLFNAVVADTLPAGTTFVSAGDSAPGPGAFTCSADGQKVTCSGGTLRGSLNGGASREIDVVAKAPHANGPITDQATADPANAVVEANESNNSSTVTTDVESLIELATSLDKPHIGAGSEGHIVGHIKNKGTADASNVAFELDLPVGITPLDVQAPANTSCQIYQNPISKVVCTSATVPAGADLLVDAHVYSNTDDQTSANAIVNGDHAVVEKDDGNDTDDTAQATS